MSGLGVRVVGTGSYLPEKIVTNEDLAGILDTSDEWIQSRTGIVQRHQAAPDEATSDLGRKAAERALEAAGVTVDEIDLIICATMTPDHLIPSTAALIQRDLGARNAGGFDLGSACAGFVHSFNVATGYIKAGMAETVLVVGAETMSSATDPKDRATRVIFADGAGAAVLRPCKDGSSDLLAMQHGLHGDSEVLVVPAGGSRLPASAETVAERQHYIRMKGRETFRFAVKTMAALIKDTCAKAGVSTDEIKLVVPHQVNQRILEPAAERAGISMDKAVVNIDRVGNTSAASVPIALDEALRAGRVERGDLILMVAFGAGLSWASALVRW